MQNNDLEKTIPSDEALDGTKSYGENVSVIKDPGLPDFSDEEQSVPVEEPESEKPAEVPPPSCPANHIYVLDPVAVRRMTNPVTARQRGETQTRLRDLLLQHQHLASTYPLRPYRWPRTITAAFGGCKIFWASKAKSCS